MTFEYNQRGHQVYRVIEVDIATAPLAVFVVPVLYLRFVPAVVPEPETTDLVVVPELDHVPDASG